MVPKEERGQKNQHGVGAGVKIEGGIEDWYLGCSYTLRFFWENESCIFLVDQIQVMFMPCARLSFSGLNKDEEDTMKRELWCPLQGFSQWELPANEEKEKGPQNSSRATVKEGVNLNSCLVQTSGWKTALDINRQQSTSLHVILFLLQWWWGNNSESANEGGSWNTKWKIEADSLYSRSRFWGGGKSPF